jgi:glycosyltransferase involved in cell wall biosynthesis
MIAPITIITPTTGKDSLKKLCFSLEKQSVKWVHILLWDSKRDGEFLYPNIRTYKIKSPQEMTGPVYDKDSAQIGIRYSIEIPGTIVQGNAAGSALRAIGLMAAYTPYVTFADDDVWYEPDHLQKLLGAIEGKQWAYGRRKVWASEKDYIGVDNFESVGDSPTRKVPYEMADNNTMIFTRRFGSSGAVVYRETKDYNDDRMMYDFLKKYAGEPGKLEEATVNQICPHRLERMFRQYCDNN